MKSKRHAGDSLQAANLYFHDAHCNARDDVEREIPILVLMPRELVLHRHGERNVHAYSRAFFDAAKAAAHVAVAFADCLSNGDDSREARETFARSTGPEILRITELATCEQIASLHEAVQITVSHLSAEELRMLQVIVVGDHQARPLSLG